MISLTWAQFERALVGKTPHVTRREYDWVFDFGKAGLCVESLWRIRNNQSILLTNSDDGHQYGLPDRIDAERRANEIFASAVATGLESDEATGDLRIRLAPDLTLEILTISSGYESWQALLGSDMVAVGGNGG